MKKSYGLVVVMTLLALIFPAISVVAMEETTDTQPSTTETQPQNYEVEDDPKSTDYQTKLKERLAARKAALKTRLTNAQQKRVQTRCKTAQTLISKIAEKAKSAKTTREEAYDKIVDHATKISAKLKEHGKDTTALDKNITELQALIVTFKTDMQTLRQTASDISNMECATDPTSFQASLEILRTARKAVTDDAIAIRTYVKDDLKVTLETIRTSLGDAKKEETN